MARMGTIEGAKLKAATGGFEVGARTAARWVRRYRQCRRAVLRVIAFRSAWLAPANAVHTLRLHDCNFYRLHASLNLNTPASRAALHRNTLLTPFNAK